MTLGEKIRARRRALGLTQKDVGGDTVTRNMICAIEHGDVSPSLATLTAIAEALSLPIAYLLSEEEDPSLYMQQELLPRLRAAHSAGRYADVLSLTRRLPETAKRDEVAAFLVSSLVHLAERALHDGNLGQIPALVAEAQKYAGKTALPLPHLLARAELCLGIAKSPEAPRWGVNTEQYFSHVNRAVNSELYRYLSESDYLPVENTYLAAHLLARERIAEHRYAEAVTILGEIEGKKASGEVGSYLLYRVYTDMELCYREMRDFENAYRYSTKRIALLSSFRG